MRERQKSSWTFKPSMGMAKGSLYIIIEGCKCPEKVEWSPINKKNSGANIVFF